MASIGRVSSGLTAADARRVASSSSFYVCSFIDGLTDEPIPAVAQNGSPMNDPNIVERITSQEKAALIQKKNMGQVVGSIRAREGESGFVEWDQWIISLSKEESALLQSNPEMQARFLRIIQEGFTRHPEANGKRMALVTGIHKDTGNWHVQALVHRHAIDYGTSIPTVSNAIDVNKSGVISKLIYAIQADLDRAGIPIVIDRGLTGPQNRSIFADRRVSDEAKLQAAENIAAAGGVAPPSAIIGPRVAPRTTVETPEVEKILTGLRLAEKLALESAQRVEKLQAEIEAAKRAAEEEAARVAALQHALSAIERASKLEEEVKTKAVALEEANKERDNLRNEVEKANVIITERDGQIDKLTTRLDIVTKEKENVARELQVERDSFVERAKEWAKEHLLAPIQRELDELKKMFAEFTKTKEKEIEEAKKNAIEDYKRSQANVKAEVKSDKGEEIDLSFQRKHPDNWTDEERKNAERLFEKRKGKDKFATAYEMGEVMHEKYLEKNAKNAPKPKF